MPAPVRAGPEGERVEAARPPGATAGLGADGSADGPDRGEGPARRRPAGLHRRPAAPRGRAQDPRRRSTAQQRLARRPHRGHRGRARRPPPGRERRSRPGRPRAGRGGWHRRDPGGGPRQLGHRTALPGRPDDGGGVHLAARDLEGGVRQPAPGPARVASRRRRAAAGEPPGRAVLPGSTHRRLPGRRRPRPGPGRAADPGGRVVAALGAAHGPARRRGAARPRAARRRPRRVPAGRQAAVRAAAGHPGARHRVGSRTGDGAPVRRAPDPAEIEALGPGDHTWLADGNTFPLAALRPARLLRAVERAVERAGSDPDQLRAAELGFLAWPEPGR